MEKIDIDRLSYIEKFFEEIPAYLLPEKCKETMYSAPFICGEGTKKQLEFLCKKGASPSAVVLASIETCYAMMKKAEADRTPQNTFFS